MEKKNGRMELYSSKLFKRCKASSISGIETKIIDVIVAILFIFTLNFVIYI